MEKNINKFKMEELGLLILNTTCYSALIITSVIILLTVLSSLLSKKIILADYSKQSFEVNELLKFLVFYPIGEELLLRGLILQFLKKKTKYANLIQAVIFGILHLNPIKIIYTTISGIFFGNVRLRPNPIWWIILLHSTFNLVSIFLYKPFMIIVEKIFYLQNMPIITLIIVFIPPLFIFDYTLKQLKNKFNYEKLYKA
ncbi:MULTISPECIES: CPBP family intramembrane glutamic endopeptidase [unclassified Leptotrichia]|uniref:CPBP family intramembrane glutamic endopeptidase n=1 Tax=unclassified Leptotrichia TaxID=2633022 RepID=UPI0004065835|nr:MULTISPECIES: CPBP family intramembrane glutamic endopeptidase [unclassified Leptotrichia]WLD75120.1 CPBP family intramembrane metalloprotease [Leptotrichia sp. HMT-225]